MRYSNLEATRIIFFYIFSCLFVLSCKQAVYNKEDSQIKQDTVKAILPSKIDSLSLNSNDNIVDSFPLGFADLLKKDSTILTDIRYATDSNFTKQQLYPCPRCILKEELINKLSLVNQELIGKGYRLKILDCYRPLSVQKNLWEVNPNPHYVMSPAKGSGHSRGTAVDLTLVTFEGKDLDMGSAYDEFSERAYYAYSGSPPRSKAFEMVIKINYESLWF